MCDTLVSLGEEGVHLAKNSDRDPVEPQVVEYHPAAEHPPELLRVTHTAIPQVRRTHAVLISRPWWMWGAEMGANQHGLVIGNEAVFTRGGGDEGELLGMDLLRLALERATDRHDGVEVIVGLLERHGQGGSCSVVHPRFRYDNSFLLADAEGAVVLETAGRRWATEEVRAPGRAISNALTIPGFAEEHTDPLRTRVAHAAVRRQHTQAAAETATGPLDLFAALRDHGPLPPEYQFARPRPPRWTFVNGALSSACAHAGGALTSTQTTASWVAEPATGRHWVTATSAPCTSLFKPLRVAPTPGTEPEASGRYHPQSLWWRHERVHRAWTRDPGSFADLARRRNDLERIFVMDGCEKVAGAWEAADSWEELAADVRPRGDIRPAWVRAQWRLWDSRSGVRPLAWPGRRVVVPAGGDR